MKKLQYDIQVNLNINNEYRITISDSKPKYKQFGNLKELKKFVNTEEFIHIYKRLRHRSTLNFYNGEYDAFILITSGKHKGSFCCVSDLSCLMTRYNEEGKKGDKWTMTKSNKVNHVSGHSAYDQKRWAVNKPYEDFKTKIANGKVNHFRQAYDLHQKDNNDADQRLAQMLATLSPEQIANIMALQNEIRNPSTPDFY